MVVNQLPSALHVRADLLLERIGGGTEDDVLVVGSEEEEEEEEEVEEEAAADVVRGVVVSTSTAPKPFEWKRRKQE